MTCVHSVLDPAAGIQVEAGLCALAVMTKAPRAGRVKTRLSPPLTPAEAAALNTCFLRDTAAAIAMTAAAGLAHGVGVYTPFGEERAYEDILPAEFYLVLQRGNLFGERLTNAAEDLRRVGFESFCLIDSDSPTVPQAAYVRAVQLLSEAGDRIVLGPSDDGGYYLIGLKRPERRVFEEIDWSTEHVAEQTIERAKEAGMEIALLPTWYDVDDQATLHRLCHELLGERCSTTTGYAATATKTFLAGIVASEGRARIWPAT